VPPSLCALRDRGCRRCVTSSLSSLAQQHIRTLLRSVACHAADPNIALFGQLLNHTYAREDMAFYVAVMALCRYGVPRRAWAIAGLPVGGRAKLKTSYNWRIMEMAGMLR
jgi:hypothetical protein